MSSTTLAGAGVGRPQGQCVALKACTHASLRPCTHAHTDLQSELQQPLAELKVGHCASAPAQLLAQARHEQPQVAQPLGLVLRVGALKHLHGAQLAVDGGGTHAAQQRQKGGVAAAAADAAGLAALLAARPQQAEELGDVAVSAWREFGAGLEHAG